MGAGVVPGVVGLGCDCVCGRAVMRWWDMCVCVGGGGVGGGGMVGFWGRGSGAWRGGGGGGGVERGMGWWGV